MSLRLLMPVVGLLALSACTAEKKVSEPPPLDKLLATVEGTAHHFRLTYDAITFCDSRGARKLDLLTGKESAGEGACAAAADEANTACSGLAIDASVRSPQGQPDDIVDIADRSYPMKGRVHDCVADGKLFAVLTGSGIVLINTLDGQVREISNQGGQRLALGGGWIAWMTGVQLRIERLNKSGHERRAIEGDVDAARRAGTMQAKSATNPNTPHTAARVTASNGFTP